MTLESEVGSVEICASLSEMADKVVKAKTEYDPAAKIWRGPRQPDRYPPDTSLGSVLIENLLKDPEHVGQVSKSEYLWKSGRNYFVKVLKC